MKKIFVFVLFSFLFIPITNVFATSGACSYHGGVNCSAGASSTGKVQCNDGWTNSSVYFSDAAECHVIYSCPTPISLQCNTESDYQNLLQEVTQERSRARALNASSGLLGSGRDNSSTVGQDRLDSCRQSINVYNNSVSLYNQCMQGKDNVSSQKAVEAETSTLLKFNAFCEDRNGKGSVYDPSYTDFYNPCTAGKKEIVIGDDDFSNKIKKLVSDIESCKTEHGSESTYDNQKNRCECRIGTGPDSQKPYQCIPLDNWCKAEAGNGATNDVFQYVDGIDIDHTCKCSTGYKWNTEKTQCVSIKTTNKLSKAKPIEIKDPIKERLKEPAPIILEEPVISPINQPAPIQKRTLFQKVKNFFSSWLK